MSGRWRTQWCSGSRQVESSQCGVIATVPPHPLLKRRREATRSPRRQATALGCRCGRVRSHGQAAVAAAGEK